MHSKAKEKRRAYLEDKVCSNSVCKSTINLCLHHIDPVSEDNKKSSKHMWGWPEERFQVELAKCIILCKVCHDAYHASQHKSTWKHGTTTGYRSGCRCIECISAKAEYKVKYRIEHPRKLVERPTKLPIVQTYLEHLRTDIDRSSPYAILARQIEVHITRIQTEDGECWKWLSVKKDDPYIRLDGKFVPMVRVIYMIWVGPIPERRQIRRSCKTAGCLQPMHLVVLGI